MLPENDKISVDLEMESLFRAPAREQILNYTKEQMDMVVPLLGSEDDVDDDMFVGMTQSSFFPEDSQHPLYNMADPDNTTEQISLKVYYECTEAIRNSGQYDLEKELLDKMHELIVRARKSNTPPTGKRVSCMPANSKQCKHHGTSHY